MASQKSSRVDFTEDWANQSISTSCISADADEQGELGVTDWVHTPVRFLGIATHGFKPHHGMKIRTNQSIQKNRSTNQPKHHTRFLAFCGFYNFQLANPVPLGRVFGHPKVP